MIQKLQEYFEEASSAREYDAFVAQFTRYFEYIENTHPLNSLMEDIFTQQKQSVVIQNAYKFYASFLRHNRDVTPPSIGITPNSRVSFEAFHNELLEKAKKMGIQETVKATITLNTKEFMISSSQSVTAYRLKPRNIGASQRFKIIMYLFNLRTGVSVQEILQHLKKDGDPQKNREVIRREISAINKQFKKNLGVDDDLIVIQFVNGMNIYFLNRDVFDFKNTR